MSYAKDHRGTFEERFLAKIEHIPFGCPWIWVASVSSAGYGQIKRGDAMVKAHRIAYEMFVGEVPEGLFVCHTCDNKLCVWPGHLFLGTADDNNKDAMRKGRTAKGEQHWKSKLTKDEVLAIRDAEGVQEDIARQFGVCQNTVSGIKLGKYWRHI